jgi:hypothetical protein
MDREFRAKTPTLGDDRILLLTRNIAACSALLWCMRQCWVQSHPFQNALAATAAQASGRGTERRFEYGWLRAAGSAAFALGTLVSGWQASVAGLATPLSISGALLASAAWPRSAFWRCRHALGCSQMTRRMREDVAVSDRRQGTTIKHGASVGRLLGFEGHRPRRFLCKWRFIILR